MIVLFHIDQVIACLDVRANDNGDLVVTKGDQYDVREHTDENEVHLHECLKYGSVMPDIFCHSNVSF